MNIQDLLDKAKGFLTPPQDTGKTKTERPRSGGFFSGAPKVIEVDDQERGQYAAIGDDVVWVGKTGNTKKIAKAIFDITLISLIAAIGLYAVLGATLIRITPESQGFTIVRSGTFIGGNPESGDLIHISGTKTSDGSFKEKLQYSFTKLPKAATLEVIAGPYGDVTVNEENRIYFNGADTTYNGTVTNAPVYIGEEFLARCVTGECTTGKIYTIPKENIFGEAIINSQGDLEEMTKIAANTTPAPETDGE